MHPRDLLPIIFVAAVTAIQFHTHDESFTPDYVLNVTRQDVSIGGLRRYSTLVNGTVPGPELRLSCDKIVWIRVYNDMTDANLTMHWHGLAQATFPFSDGTPLASQWPIPPQHFFDYELHTAREVAGTYFYHSHVDFQSVTASGPLIIEDDHPPYETDGDRILHIQEIYKQTDEVALAGIEATPIRWPGDPLGFMINGKTIARKKIDDPESKALAVIHVDPDKTYRFRFIGAQSLALAMLAFENHTDLQLIEADGGYTKPYPIDLLQLGAGQRFSTLFKTKTCQELKQADRLDFYIQIENRDGQIPFRNYGVLRYSDHDCNHDRNHDRNHDHNDDLNLPENSIPRQRVSTDSNPKHVLIQLPPTINGFLDYVLEPLHPNNVPTADEVTRRVIVNIQLTTNQSFIWKDNGVGWFEDVSPLGLFTPSEPYLVSLYQNQTKYLPHYDDALANGGLDPHTKTYPARRGEVIEIVLQQLGGISHDGTFVGTVDTHPWHAHGGHYYDIGGGEGTFDADTAEARLRGTTPILRDTTMLYRYRPAVGVNQTASWRAWRLRVQYPGVWMIHCHMLQHIIAGLQMPWVVGDVDDILKLPRLEVEGYLTYGGDVYGNRSHAPRVLHFEELKMDD